MVVLVRLGITCKYGLVQYWPKNKQFDWKQCNLLSITQLSWKAVHLLPTEMTHLTTWTAYEPTPNNDKCTEISVSLSLFPYSLRLFFFPCFFLSMHSSNPSYSLSAILFCYLSLWYKHPELTEQGFFHYMFWNTNGHIHLTLIAKLEPRVVLNQHKVDSSLRQKKCLSEKCLSKCLTENIVTMSNYNEALKSSQDEGNV